MQNVARNLSQCYKKIIAVFKKMADLYVTLTMQLKVKPIVSSYIPLQTLQLSSETFFHIYSRFLNPGLDFRNTLYMLYTNLFYRVLVQEID